MIVTLERFYDVASNGSIKRLPFVNKACLQVSPSFSGCCMKDLPLKMPKTPDAAPPFNSRSSLPDLEAALGEEPVYENVLRIKKCIDHYRFKLDLLKTSLRYPSPGPRLAQGETFQENHDQIVTIQAKRKALEGILKMKDRPEQFKVAMRQFIQDNLGC